MYTLVINLLQIYGDITVKIILQKCNKLENDNNLTKGKHRQ